MHNRLLRRVIRLAASASLLALGSCATHYDARFEPAPMEVKIESAEAPGVLARALATVRGVRRPTSEQSTAQVELALRIENVGSKPFALDPQSFELATADLQVLRPGLVSPQSDAPLEPGAAQHVEVVFPLAPKQRYRDLDFSGLVVSWSLKAGSQTLTASARFERRSLQSAPYYYGNYWVGPGFWRFYPRVGAFCAY